MPSNAVIHILTRLLALLLLGFCPTLTFGQVVAGDIVVIRVNNGGDGGTESFTWLALNDLESPQILWTDSSWGHVLTDGVRSGWQYLEESNHHGTAWLPSGTILAGTTGEVTFDTGLTASDQIFFYTGREPTHYDVARNEHVDFLFGMTFGEPWLTSGSTSNSKSYEPEQIRNLGVSVALGPGTHWYYTGPTSGTATAILAEIRNPENWTVSDDNSKHSWAEISGADFQIGLVPEPADFALAAGIGGLLIALRQRQRSKSVNLN